MFGLHVLRSCLGTKTKSISAAFFLLFFLSAVNVDFFNHEQCIRVLFIDSQISLFINFFIKNESHNTIHTFKNYLLQCFSIFNFNFQFLTISKKTLSFTKFKDHMVDLWARPCGPNSNQPCSQYPLTVLQGV